MYLGAWPRLSFRRAKIEFKIIYKGDFGQVTFGRNNERFHGLPGGSCSDGS